MANGFGAWWKRTSGTKKTVVIFATLLVLQMGLCFSTGYWLPVYQHAIGARQDIEDGIGYLGIQFFLCGFTFFIFIVSLIVVAARRKLPQSDSNREQQ
jgi:hypothetical protein